MLSSQLILWTRCNYIIGRGNIFRNLNFFKKKCLGKLRDDPRMRYFTNWTFFLLMVWSVTMHGIFQYFVDFLNFLKTIPALEKKKAITWFTYKKSNRLYAIHVYRRHKYIRIGVRTLYVLFEV